MFKKNLLYFFFKRTIAFVVILSLFTTSTIFYPNQAKSQAASLEIYDCQAQSLTNVNGDIVKQYDYDPFGNIRSSSGTSNTNYEFQSQQLDPESSMYFLRARYYDPTIGRFISKDPIKGSLMNPQTQNPYAYAANNPINLHDPSGEAWFLYLLDAAGTTLDAISLSEAISNCDWGGAGLSAISLGIPFVSFGGMKYVSRAVDVAKLTNKTSHIFGDNTVRHGLTNFLNSFGGNETKAVQVVQKEMQGLANQGKVPQDFTGGIIITVNGFPLTVTGKIINGVAEIGTFFISK